MCCRAKLFSRANQPFFPPRQWQGETPYAITLSFILRHLVPNKCLSEDLQQSLQPPCLGMGVPEAVAGRPMALLWNDRE